MNKTPGPRIPPLKKTSKSETKETSGFMVSAKGLSDIIETFALHISLLKARGEEPPLSTTRALNTLKNLHNRYDAVLNPVSMTKKEIKAFCDLKDHSMRATLFALLNNHRV